MEEEKQKLAELLEIMDVPEIRKDLDQLENIIWLRRNLWKRNRFHRRVMEAVVFAEKIRRGK